MAQQVAGPPDVPVGVSWVVLYERHADVRLTWVMDQRDRPDPIAFWSSWKLVDTAGNQWSGAGGGGAGSTFKEQQSYG